MSVSGIGGRAAAHVRARAAPASGSLASPKVLADRLRLFNLNNDAQVRAQLAAGSGFGRTDLTLIATQPARLSADLFTDNAGFASTGRAEVGAVVRGYRLITGADRLSLVGVVSRGVRSATASYGTPLGQRLRMSANLSYGRTRGGDVAGLIAAGDNLSLTGTVSASRGRSDTSVAGARIIRNISFNASAGLTLIYAVPGLSATLQGQAAYARVDERLSGVRVAPVLFQGSTALAKAVVPRVQMRLRADWQLATRSALPGLLQYQIGGPRSSRGFSPGVAAGDRGLATSAELGWAAITAPLGVEPFVFLDRAATTLPGQHYRATSAGGGVNVSLTPRVAVRASLAHSIEAVAVAPDHRGYLSANVRL